MFQFVKNLFIYFFFESGGVRKMVSIRISRKRLQWAEISFSGTCHESRYETLFGEAENTFFFIYFFFAAVDRCG